MQARRLCSLVLTVLLATATAHAEKLKGYYSGSGGLSAEVHRVVMVQFAEDGTVMVQQNWDSGKSDVWHAHWTQDRNKVTITFDPQKDSPQVTPLVVNVKHGSLVPETWDSAAMGPLGPPTLAPFGGKNVLKRTVNGCVSLVNADPSQAYCTQWGSQANIK